MVVNKVQIPVTYTGNDYISFDLYFLLTNSRTGLFRSSSKSNRARRYRSRVGAATVLTVQRAVYVPNPLFAQKWNLSVH